nr:hypothetical protein Iba_chr03bCG11610 [Ipomoea batatas]GMC72452.1 hypothetical protein Iba_chr03bCG11620 [Ipomoea batatas]GMC96415.1 hypothetical protein Iba_chr05cCG17870 [Ipomoea batatas]GMD05886.1 hypothetical protein Iba_chr06bCG10760 [Ipomoea batatas]GMD46345.1 hypothetical protein Iba_chr10eCG2390 [Ipomoea batatas]
MVIGNAVTMVLGSEDSAVSVQELQVNEEEEDIEQEEDPQFDFLVIDLEMFTLVEAESRRLCQKTLTGVH